MTEKQKTHMSVSEAIATIDSFDKKYVNKKYADLRVEDVLDPTLAEALFVFWQAEWEEPGFNQPPAWLVEAVEEIVGEDVWPDEDAGAG
jgi:hypothetical protein